MFTHLENKIHYELEATTTKSGRLYKTPEGDEFPSVTTVLGYRSKEAILAWRKRVGEEEANRISRHAAGRGTKVHYLAEDYINNKEIPLIGMMPHVVQMWNSLKKSIDGHIDNVRAQEVPLYSKQLRLAGRVDCIAEYDGEPAIIDFKTSSKIKKREHISNYFMQAAAYACMYAERTGEKINKLVVLMTVEGEPDPLIFIEKTNDWVDKLIEEVTYYYENN
jgi:CRISPR/Cas system-associated exonuclease Cas4 (RecB family)